MKKNRMFAVLLIIALFASIMSVSAVADNENASYKEYFIFGDSVATGYGLKEGNDLLGYIRAPEGDDPDTRNLFEAIRSTCWIRPINQIDMQNVISVTLATFR